MSISEMNLRSLGPENFSNPAWASGYADGIGGVRVQQRTDDTRGDYLNGYSHGFFVENNV